MVEVQYPICAGIDVHARQFNVCLLRRDGATVVPEHRDFDNLPAAIAELVEWLQQAGCQAVAMESTGVYWRPLHRALSRRGIAVIVGNPAHIRQIPGKKTDTADAQWIANLAMHGLIRPSFVPAPEWEPIREVMRQRTHYIQQRTTTQNRLTRQLECHGIKLLSVLSGIGTLTALRILDAIADGETDVGTLARLRHGNCKATQTQLREALASVPELSDADRFVLRGLLDDHAHFERQIARLERWLDDAMAAYEQVVARLCTIPGISQLSARTILAEIGTDMQRFGSPERLASWAGVCPGNHESAGKRHSGRTRKGNPYLKRVLTQCAWSLKKSEDFLGTKFRQLRARIGAKKAVVAIAHKLLTVVWHVLASGQNYRESAPGRQTHERQQRRLNRLRRELQAAGYQVLPPTADPALA